MNTQPKTTPPVPTGDHAVLRPRVDSGDILRGNSAVEIEHAGQCYLLRVTRENKLILTK